MTDPNSVKNEVGSVTGTYIGGAANNNTIKTTVNERQEAKEDNPSAGELLNSLKASIQNESSLSEENKNMALQEVQKLEEALNNPENPTKKQEAKTAKYTLLGILTESLPTAAKLVEEFKKLLPYIASALGLG
ncbi:hypothetical protein [Laspinema olomoucense]|uniref:Uncharacterized protein n=1 Tax=Laspinema olomoucense D3b TaxID=2953688 RepID=A0ABT2NAR4_9CYAN|nr:MULTISPECIES: hypothetical protein [unclassified Laspinema]MCT7978440.1 hypothetical protein [Laspinema sp. D3b]MCT7991076.1 hypothetical protein [Laspinema sp. D3a]